MNVVPFSLDQMQLATHAEASFADGATLDFDPGRRGGRREDITYTLSLRNVGDGSAKRLNVRLDTPTNSVYAPGSTTVNDVGLLDFAGTSPLLAPNGLTLGDVGAGRGGGRLRAIVNTPLPADAVIDTQGYVLGRDAEMIVKGGAACACARAPALRSWTRCCRFRCSTRRRGRRARRIRARLPPGRGIIWSLPPADAGAAERYARCCGADHGPAAVGAGRRTMRWSCRASVALAACGPSG